jgi:hypothetical protein
MGSAENRAWHAQVKVDAKAHGKVPIEFEKDPVGRDIPCLCGYIPCFRGYNYRQRERESHSTPNFLPRPIGISSLRRDGKS